MYDQLARMIRERRTVRKYSKQGIPDQVILEWLNDAVWAPYHSAKDPWRFILFSDAGRKTFAQAVLETYTRQELEQYGESAKRDYCENAAAHLIVVAREEPRPREAEELFWRARHLFRTFSCWHGTGESESSGKPMNTTGTRDSARPSGFNPGRRSLAPFIWDITLQTIYRNHAPAKRQNS